MSRLKKYIKPAARKSNAVDSAFIDSATVSGVSLNTDAVSVDLDESKLSDRELEEIAFCRVYAFAFNHGSDGHIRMNVIAKLSQKLESVEEELAALKRKLSLGATGIVSNVDHSYDYYNVDTVVTASGISGRYSRLITGLHATELTISLDRPRADVDFTKPVRIIND